MSYTAAASAIIAADPAEVGYRLYLKTFFAESNSWLEFPFKDFTLTQQGKAADTLKIDMYHGTGQTHTPGSVVERSKTNRQQLGALVLLDSYIGSETRHEFYGRVEELSLTDYGVGLSCRDWRALIEETECQSNIAPTEVEVVAAGAYRALSELAAISGVYVLTVGAPTDEGFDEDTQTRRRSWAPAGDTRVYYYEDSEYKELPSKHYEIDWVSGAVAILEDETRSYFVSALRCYKETAAAGAANVDYSNHAQDMLQLPKARGGIGATSSDWTIPALGLDAGAIVTFPGETREAGRPGDLLRSLQDSVQQNLELRYDAENSKWIFAAIEQKDYGSEDWTLYKAKQISRTRSIRDLYTRVVVTGLMSQPRNVLADSGTTITGRTIVDAEKWFDWDGLNVGADVLSFNNVKGLLFDGDGAKGASVHRLPDSENGGTDRYDSWYDFITIDIGLNADGSLKRVQRIKALLPGSRNINAQGGHLGIFWPGLLIEGSTDGSNWFAMAAGLYKIRGKPHSRVEASGKEIQRPYARYIRIRCGAYKHGYDNQSDPSIGLAELEIFIAEQFRYELAVQGATPSGVLTYSSGATWSNYHTNLLTRFGDRFRTQFKDYGDKYPPAVARDIGIQLLSEGVRLFDAVRYRTAGPDPRPRYGETLLAPDSWSGDSSFLAEQVTKTSKYTEVAGTDYKAPALSNTP